MSAHFFMQVKILLCDDAANINSGKTSFSASGVLTELLKNIWQQMRSLASPPLLKYALLCWTIYFANMFGYVFHNWHFAAPRGDFVVDWRDFIL